MTGTATNERVLLCIGKGIVLRRGSTTIAIFGSDAAVVVASMEAALGSYEGWSDLVRHLASSIVQLGFDEHPSLVAIRREADHARVFVFGSQPVVAHIADGSIERVDATDSPTWVDTEVRNPVSLEATGLSGVASQWSHLESGVIEAGGFVSVFGEAAPIGEATTQLSGEELASIRAAAVARLHESSQNEEPPSDDPAATLAPEVSESTTMVNSVELRNLVSTMSPVRLAKPARHAGETIKGRECAEGHLNRLQDNHCWVCESAISREAPIVERPRPSLGFLEFDDGQSFELTTSFIVGRSPGDTQQATPIVVDDDRHMVSKRHLEIRLEGWDVKIMDLGSSNGTILRRADVEAARTIRLRPHDEVKLNPEMVVELGDRSFRYLAARDQ